MGSPERIQIPVRETRVVYTPEGHRVGPVGLLDKPEEIVENRVDLDPTVTHETGHTLVGRKRGIRIHGVEIKRRGNAPGTTYPGSFDAPTAAAGYATGTGGDGHDRFVTEVIYRKSFDQAATIASAIIKDNQETFMDLGKALQTYKYLSERDIDSEIAKSEKRQQIKNNKTQAYGIPIKTKDGREETVRVEVPKGATMLHVPLPQSRDIFVAAEREISLSP